MSKIKVNGFVLSFAVPASDGPQIVRLEIRRDHHAELILRGLVHSGYVVTIKECEIEVEASPDEKAELNARYGRNGYVDTDGPMLHCEGRR